MFVVLGLMFCGIFAGWLLKRFLKDSTFLRSVSKGISITIYLLLFFLGVSLGANEELIVNLPLLGGRSLFIAVMVVLGSCIAAKFVYILFFKSDPLFSNSTDSSSLFSKNDSQFPDNSSQSSENVSLPGEKGGGSLTAIRGSLVVVGFFVLGVIVGFLSAIYGFLPDALVNGSVTQYVLYLLMIQVGISIGSDDNLKSILRSIRPKLLLIPLATIVGSLLFAALSSIFISKWSFCQIMAVGSGFAYYSLSSILITQLQEPIIGMQQAVELGTVALMANIFREIIALLGAPFFYKYFGQFAPICVGGATTMDTTLPIISEVCGKRLIFVSIFHGVLVDFSVPVLVTLFIS